MYNNIGNIDDFGADPRRVEQAGGKKYDDIQKDNIGARFSELGFTFNAKELDNETGLYYYGARYLDPTGAMWLSVDPLFEKYAGMSPYNYCAGNPVKLVDPDGNKAKDYFLGFVGAVADNAVLELGNLRGYCARFVTDARDFNRGLDAGDAISIAQGANEVYTGGCMMKAGSSAVTVGLATEVPSGGSSTVVVVGGGVIMEVLL